MDDFDRAELIDDAITHMVGAVRNIREAVKDTDVSELAERCLVSHLEIALGGEHGSRWLGSSQCDLTSLYDRMIDRGKAAEEKR